MTIKTIEFLYKDHRAQLSAAESEGKWHATAQVTEWYPATSSNVLFPTEEAAIEAARKYVTEWIDREEWKEQFRNRWDELVFGESEWEFESHEHDWATQEWEKREGRTGSEHAQMIFDADPEFKAKYLPGGSSYEARAKWDKSLVR